MTYKKYHPVIFLTAFAAFIFSGVGVAGAAAQSARTHGKVPATLQNIEGNAEDIFDLAGSGDWTQVSRNVASISDSWSAYKQEAGTRTPQPMQQSFASGLEQLQQASAAKNTAKTMQAANDLSAVVVDLYDLYNPTIPADVGRLDVLERQVILHTKTGQPEAVSKDLARINTVWDRLKPSIEAHGGSTIARQFRKSLADQFKAHHNRNKVELTAQANHALDLVDGLEKLYG